MLTVKFVMNSVYLATWLNDYIEHNHCILGRILAIEYLYKDVSFITWEKSQYTILLKELAVFVAFTHIKRYGK